MFWLVSLVDEILAAHPEGEVIVSSGVSPSGPYHVGTLREVLSAEAIAREIVRRGRAARHIHISDDLDVFRKVPANVPEDFKQYLGRPLCEVPSPDGQAASYADYFLGDLPAAAKDMHLSMEIMRSSQKYRAGFFIEAIEKALANVDTIRGILEEISGHKLDDNWSPVQVLEDGYLKNRKFVSLDSAAKTIRYLDADGKERQISYANGEVKLNWRIDWPARWWLLGVEVEPFGRDHATKGGSFDTGAEIVRKVYGAQPPLPVPYNFINKTGDTKKMSKSAGDTITAADLLKILPPEVVWYFMLRFPPEKQLFFDEGPALIKLIDDFAELVAKPDKTEAEQQLLDISMQGIDQPTISSVPFSHLVASYQAALKDEEKTLEIIRRTEHKQTVDAQADIIKRELKFIDQWLSAWAPEDLKFSLAANAGAAEFSDEEKNYLRALAEAVAAAPEGADGEWFHKAIYKFKETDNLSSQQLFNPLYRALIGKEQGPRAGWFLSILPRDWLIGRLRLES
jgi:lysyl-tRNA synthetase class 1